MAQPDGASTKGTGRTIHLAQRQATLGERGGLHARALRNLARGAYAEGHRTHDPFAQLLDEGERAARAF